MRASASRIGMPFNARLSVHIFGFRRRSDRPFDFESTSLGISIRARSWYFDKSGFADTFAGTRISSRSTTTSRSPVRDKGRFGYVDKWPSRRMYHANRPDRDAIEDVNHAWYVEEREHTFRRITNDRRASVSKRSMKVWVCASTFNRSYVLVRSARPSG